MASPCLVKEFGAAVVPFIRSIRDVAQGQPLSLPAPANQALAFSCIAKVTFGSVSVGTLGEDYGRESQRSNIANLLYGSY